jgi:hypothetical protein
MMKKLSLLLAAIAALAFAAPTLASASTGLTENGGLVAVGSRVTGTNIGAVTITSAIFGNITCGEMMLEGEVKKNGAAVGVEVGAAGANSMGNCAAAGMAVEATSVTFTNLTSTAAEAGTGKASLSWKIDLPAVTCKFTAEAAPFTYVANGDVIKFAKAPLAVAPAAACGVATLDAEFTLSTPNNVKFEIM